MNKEKVDKTLFPYMNSFLKDDGYVLESLFMGKFVCISKKPGNYLQLINCKSWTQ